MSDRKRAFGDGFSGFLRLLRQPRVVVILGNFGRRIDIAASVLRRHIRSWATRAVPWTRGSRFFSGVVGHGLNLSVDAADLKFPGGPLAFCSVAFVVVGTRSPFQGASSPPAPQGKALLRMISGAVTALNKPL